MNNFDFSTLSLNKANKIGKFGDIINSPENIGRIIDTNPLIIEVTKSGTIHTYKRLQNHKLWIWKNEYLDRLEDQDII